MKTEELLALLEPRISPDRICHLAQAIHERDQWNSFDRYKQTADLLVREFQQARADAVQRFVIPCDGQTTFGDWVMPLAWDAQDGTLELLDFQGRRDLLLADYRAVPNNLIRWSAPLEGPREFPLLFLPEAAKEEPWPAAGARGKFVFTHSPARQARRWAAKYGAAGIVSDFSTAPEAYPHAVHWENVWTDLALWGPTKEDVPLAGFSISPAVGKELEKRLGSRRAGRTVRALLRARLYPGTSDVLTATIAGAERPREEVVCYAHVYECQIDDNATSAAACVEMVRVAKDLVEAGLLPPPARTIRFVLGWEWIGSTWYAMNRQAGGRWLASLCLDGMAHRQDQTHSPIHVGTSPAMAASFADALFVQIWKEQFRRLPMKAWRTGGWTAGTDTYWVDPQLGGVSNIYPFQGTGPTWHKSHTNVDMIDRDVARASSTACLAWMLSIAGAGAREADRFARLAADRLERRVRRHVAGFDFARRDVEAAREQFLCELGYLEASARGTIDTAHLAPGDAALAGTIDGLAGRLAATARDAREQAESAFAAARSALSDWEARRPEDLLRDRDERVADNLVPRRLMPGYLWSLHRFPSEERWKFQEIGRLDPLCLFLCDGKRSLREIARLRQFEQGPLSLRGLLRHFRMLASAGYVELAAKRTFTAEDLLKDLRDLGIREGDTILVHSSLSGLGPLAEGGETVFAALEQAVGKEGTVCMPSFAHCTVDRPPFDPERTRSWVGELTDLFWRRPGVLRSRHPSHGLAAQGRWAEAVVRDNEKYDPYDIRGGFGRLYQLDAKILFVGCGIQCNSTLHAVEDWALLPSLSPASYHYLDASGQRVQAEYGRLPFHYRDFYSTRISTYERLFHQKGIIREGQVGLARTFLMRSRQVMEYGLELLQKRSFEFLLGRGLQDPGIRQIESRLEQWTFPEGIWEQLKALRETPPG